MSQNQKTPEKVDVSVVIPVHNEAKNIPIIFSKLQAALKKSGQSYEIIFVDDGSTDLSLKNMLALKNGSAQPKVVHFKKNKGKSAALSAGFRHAAGDKIATIDADYQEPPEEIPRMSACLENGYDLISGWRHSRQDPWIKVLSSKVFNWLVRQVAHTPLHDVNCGLKIYKKEVAKNIDLHGELHRVIPILAERKGFRVGEVKVAHRAREHGSTKFRGILRGFHGIFDLFTVLFLSSYKERPLHFFGMAGCVLFLFGLGINLFLSFRYFLGVGYIGERLPLFMLGILSMIMGFQSFCLGLVGEMLAGRRLAETKDTDEKIYE
ncbi:MAG: glycosyltransferase family 2 protein [Nitrospinales bacterium]